MNLAVIGKIILISCGIVELLAAIFDWDYFFDNWLNHLLIRILGRKIVRVIHGILSIVLMVCGILLKNKIGGNL